MKSDYSLTEEDKKDIHPATKEQRDILFQKMHKAGYEWDAEKKELKEIEQKPLDIDIDSMVASYKKRVIEKSNGYADSPLVDMCLTAFRRGIENALDELNVRYFVNKNEQKPVDEPSAFKGKLLELFQKFRYIKEGIPTNGDIIDYVDAHIQELIDIIQNKPWSEEDERKFSDILALLGGGENCHYNTPVLSTWLKLLKDRYTWKPSNEQMKALNSINVIGSISYPGQGQELINLYQDLKKLREG